MQGVMHQPGEWGKHIPHARVNTGNPSSSRAAAPPAPRFPSPSHLPSTPRFRGSLSSAYNSFYLHGSEWSSLSSALPRVTPGW